MITKQNHVDVTVTHKPQITKKNHLLFRQRAVVNCDDVWDIYDAQGPSLEKYILDE